MRDVIYADGAKPHTALDTVCMIISLCRVGVAATDTRLNIDLQDEGYRMFFESIARLAHGAVEEIEENECDAEKYRALQAEKGA